jgi:hypothetical protein
MPVTDPTPSPDILNYLVGKGIVSFQPDGTTGYIDLGNAPTFEFESEVTKLDHFSSRAGTRLKDLSIITERSATLNITLDEFSVENMAIALGGDTSGSEMIIGAVSEFVGAIRFVGTNDVGPRWQWDFPSVSLTPAGPIPLISEEWATIELTGDVLAVDGSFGTATRLS